MRLILILLVLTFRLNARESPSVALTAGGEFQSERSGPSITQSHTEIVSSTGGSTVYFKEPQLKAQNYSTDPKASNGISKNKIILLLALAIGVGVWFMSRKNSKQQTEAVTAGADAENEDITDVKKEMWNYLATPQEAEDTPEPIIPSKDPKFFNAYYNCTEGKITIRQAYANPNVGETVYLNDYFAPDGKYKIGLLSSIEVENAKIIKVIA